MSVSRNRTRRRALGRWANGMLMTPEEFDRARDWDPCYRYELINGVLIVNPPPGPSKRDPNEELGYFLRLHQKGHPQGAVIDVTLSEQDVALGNNRRRADRAIWVGLGRLPDLDRDVPTILIEFVSNRLRDRVRDYEHKRGEYLAAGVAEYWVIDRFQRTLTVFRPEPAIPPEQVVTAEGVYRTPLLPGFELIIGDLLKKADAW